MKKVNEMSMYSTRKKDRDKYSHSTFCHVIKRLFFAGIGAIAISYDHFENTIDRLESRGKFAGRAVNNRTKNDIFQRKTYYPKDTRIINNRVESIANNPNIPTKSDIDELNARISVLEIELSKLTIDNEKIN